ncbi:MAG TPA: hypothetical protein VGO52_24690 [Hyphomonadaceae bacterium]|jgi:hypothetical protein|nr:hypothetical protein [Hyphomonadaceae bacterium]
MPLSMNLLGLSNQEVVRLQDFGYKTADEIFHAVVGSPDQFKSLLSDSTIKQILVLAKSNKTESNTGDWFKEHQPLGVPADGPAVNVDFDDPEFDRKREALVDKLKHAKSDDVKKDVQTQLMELYTRRPLKHG